VPWERWGTSQISARSPHTARPDGLTVVPLEIANAGQSHETSPSASRANTAPSFSRIAMSRMVEPRFHAERKIVQPLLD
jgi:hypothetical protein